MNFARAHDLIAYLFAALGLVAISLGGAFGPFFIALLAALFLGSAVLSRETMSARSYGKGLTIGLIAIMLAQGVRALMGEPFFLMALELAAILQISRLAHRRHAADYKQIAGLSLLHLIAATVLYRDLSYAALFMGYVIVTPWMLGLTSIREALERHHGDPELESGEFDPRLEAILQRPGWVKPGFFLGTAALSLSLVAFTVAFFLAFPRVDGGFLGIRGGAGTHTTGFSDNLVLGGFGTIRDDRRVVVRLVPSSPIEDPEALLPIVLRGTSFDRYEGGRWSRTETRARTSSLQQRPIALARPPYHEEEIRFTVLSELTDESVLLIPENTLRLERSANGPGTAVNLVELRRGVDLRTNDRAETVRRYDAILGPVEESRMLQSRELDERYLQLPPSLDRLQALAKEITRGQHDPRAMAEAIYDHLVGGAYTYTLELSMADGMDPIEDFLFERRAGHCEYFSTAMTLMLRAVGVPARNVTGFVGGRWNEYGDYLAVQNGDAHSWVEVYLDGAFERFDPTPPARDAFGIEEDLLAKLQAFIDSLRMLWDEKVVGYDLSDQKAIFLALRDFFGGSSSAARSIEEPKSELSAPIKLGDRMRLVGIVTLVAAIVALVLIARSRRREREPEEVRLFRALEEAAAAKGHPRDESMTPREWAEKEGAPTALREGVEAYVALRYAGSEEREREMERLRGALEALRSGSAN
ncbi:MAG: DUF3488 domain-containing transglutaminase family protein [Sandaracinaceae bacterium]|nr:DUF3488 domain-containing transglutaminase family protein [Sandaracinaceae bacterium]